MKKNIRIRDWKIKDLAIYRDWNIGNHEWMKFNGPYYPKLTEQEVENQIQTYQLKIKEDNWETPRKRLVIADLENDHLIGTVSWYWQSEATNWKSIGIAIYNDLYWNKGIGYEALKLWIDYLFEKAPSIVRLDLRTWSGNHGMMQLAKKLGFKEEARFRKARIVNGAYFDSIGMGILREEWPVGPIGN